MWTRPPCINEHARVILLGRSMSIVKSFKVAPNRPSWHFTGCILLRVDEFKKGGFSDLVLPTHRQPYSLYYWGPAVALIGLHLFSHPNAYTPHTQGRQLKYYVCTSLSALSIIQSTTHTTYHRHPTGRFTCPNDDIYSTASPTVANDRAFGRGIASRCTILTNVAEFSFPASAAAFPHR
jgi:hypothetical protein